MSETLYASVGGRLIAAGADSASSADGYWDFGWIPPENRDEDIEAAVHAALASMPRFAIQGNAHTDDIDKVNLTELWKHPQVVAVLGYPYEGTHQLSGSCFPAGTPVRMVDGSETAIESVQPGDRVITHEGRARRVVETMTRLYDGDMVTLHVAGFAFPLEMTADHQVAILPGRGCVRWKPADEIEWKRADEIEEGDRVLIGWDRSSDAPAALDLAALLGDRALILDDLMEGREVPVSNAGMAQWIVRRSGIDWHGKVKLIRSRSENALNRHVPVCPSLARFIGLYLAEGGCDGGKVVFTFSADEESYCGEVLALTRGLFGAEGTTFVANERGTSRKVVFNSTTLAAVLKELVPGDVYTKRVPGVFFSADEETKAALILGWMHGDGYAALRPDGDPRIQGVTASSGLARDMVTLALSCGMRASASRRKPRRQSREAFDVFLSGHRAMALFPALAAARESIGARERVKDTAATRHGYARTVKKVERRAVERLRVFDFEVEEDHSFLAGGLTVHNCVGAGAGNVIASLNFVEVVKLGDPEKIILPFYPYHYGRGRLASGMRGRGEGSTGGGQAKAIRDDGIIDNLSHAELPKPSNSDALVWGKDVEMQWSAGDRSPCSDWLTTGKKYPVKTVAKLSSAAEVREALINLYPVTCASMYGHNPSVVKGVLLGKKGPRWSHQMSFHAYWKHPELGPIYWLHNQWGKCYDRETEILTESGWTKFSDLPRDAKVATLDPNTHRMEYQQPTEYHEIPYSGDLLHFHSQGVDLMVTQNHRMYLHPVKSSRPDDPAEWKVMEARDCPAHFRTKKDALWVGEEVETHRVGDIDVPMDDWLEFLGYYLSEGNCGSGKARKIRRKKNAVAAAAIGINCRNEWESKRVSYTIQISQQKPEGVATIEGLLSRLPWKFCRTKSGWVANCKALWEQLRAFGRSHEKRIPGYVRRLCRRQQRILFDAMMVGDGTYACGNATYYTSSPGMADDVQELLLKVGLAGDVAKIDRVGRDNGSGVTRYVEYRVNIKRERLTPRPQTGHRPLLVPYLGTVYCVTVPNGLVYVRRNGVAQWSGNSAHGQCPTGMPGGGVWITEADVDWICRDEVYAFSGHQGYPAADWSVPWVFEPRWNTAA